MTTYKTMCRWCGGEMELIPVKDVYNGTLLYQWRCDDGCRCKSYPFGQESEALEWASQTIPFLFQTDTKPISAFAPNFNQILINTLAVREEELK